MKIQIDRSEFLKKEVAYLGRNVISHGIKPNPSKIQTVKEFQIPTNPKEIKTYLGFLDWLCKNY